VSSIKAIRGFKDILPDEVGWWQEVERAARKVCRLFGFREIRIPVVERTELFARSIGQDTDIVEKEMYTFPDRNNESLTLRPEATAGLVRSVIENNLAADGRPLKLYFIGPMFRYERPQKGRQRQFHQFNVEVFNVDSPYMDAEMIGLLWTFLTELGLTDVTIHINSLGCPVCRPQFKQKLQTFLQGVKSDLCPDCRRRLDTNPLRILDCKVPTCVSLLEDPNVPWPTDSICPDCRRHFEVVLNNLPQAGVVDFITDPRLVRGLDYYTRTTFEARTGELGSQNAVAGGGRYDGLVKSLGGPDIPGLGFAVGLERLIMLLAAKGKTETSGPDLYLAAWDEPSIQKAFELVQEFRRGGFQVETDYTPGSLKSRMKRADKLGARRVLILGPEELAGKTGILRDMLTKAQQDFPLLPGVADRLAGLLGKKENQVD